MAKTRYSQIVCAIDVGEQKDPTTIVALRKDNHGRTWVVALEQIPLGFSYETQVPMVLHYLRQIDPYVIPIDATGTSRGLAELLKNPDRSGDYAKKVRPTISTTGRNANLKDSKQWTVPKVLAISAASTALIDLHFAEGVNRENMAAFQNQLQLFTAKRGSQNMTYGSDAVHDDWVDAFALAAFVVNNKSGMKSNSKLTSAASYGAVLDTTPDGPDRSLARYINPDGSTSESYRGSYASIYSVDFR